MKLGSWLKSFDSVNMAKFLICFLSLAITITNVYPHRDRVLFGQRKPWRELKPHHTQGGFRRPLVNRPTPCTSICISFLKFLHNEPKFLSTELEQEQIKDASSPTEKAQQFCKLENLREIECEELIKNAEKISVRDSRPCFGSSQRKCRHNICRSQDICLNKIRQLPIFAVSRKQQRPQASLECKACQTFVRAVQISILVFNFSEQVVKNSIEGLCKLVAPLKIQYEECKLVLDSLDKVIQWVEKKMSPKDICVKIGACVNSSKIINFKLHNLLYGFSSRHGKGKFPGMMDALIQEAGHATAGIPSVFGLMEMNRHPMIAEPMKCSGFRCQHRHQQYRHKYHHEAIRPEISTSRFEEMSHVRSNRRQCAVCKSAVTVISSSLRITNSTIREVLAKVRMYCDAFSPLFTVECHNILKKIAPIAQMVEQNLSPGDICVTLRYCQGNDQKGIWNIMHPRMRVVLESFKIPNPGRRILNKVTTTCQVCDTIKGNVKKTLQYYVKEMSQVTQELRELCNSTKNESSHFKCISAAGALKMMEKNVGQKLIPVLCESIRCTGPISPFGFPFKKRSKSCQKCKKITSVVIEQLKYVDSIVSMILKDVNGLCYEFDDEATFEKCDAIVKKTKNTMDFFERMLNPEGICGALGICKSASSEVDNMARTKFVSKWKKMSKQSLGTPCRLCKIAIELIEESKNAMAKIKAGFKKRCLTVINNPLDKIICNAKLIAEIKNTMAKMKTGFHKECLEVTDNTDRKMCDKITKRWDDIMAKERSGVKLNQICEDMQFCDGPHQTVPIILQL